MVGHLDTHLGGGVATNKTYYRNTKSVPAALQEHKAESCFHHWEGASQATHSAGLVAHILLGHTVWFRPPQCLPAAARAS